MPRYIRNENYECAMENSNERRTFDTVDTTSITNKNSTNIINISRRSRQLLTKKRTLISNIESNHTTDSVGDDRNGGGIGGDGVDANNDNRKVDSWSSITADTTLFHTRKHVTTPTISSKSKMDCETLEKRGIRIVDTNIKNFTNVSPDEVAAYYKSLGEWQNILPKTDYTYSPVSVYYSKKINGIIPIIPNMSRRDIWKNEEVADNEINSWKSEEIVDNEINSCYANSYRNCSNSKTARNHRLNLWRRNQIRFDSGSRTTDNVFSKANHWLGQSFSYFISRSLSSLKTCRRFVHMKTISHVHTSFRTRKWYSYLTSLTKRNNSVSSLLTKSSFPLLLLVLLALVLACTLFRYNIADSSSNNAATTTTTSTAFTLATGWFNDLLNLCGSVIVIPVYQLFNSFLSLVVNIFFLTYTSATFILNVISSASESGVNVAFTTLVNPLYESYSMFFHLVNSNKMTFSKKDESQRISNEASSLVGTDSIEQMFQHLLNVNNAHLVQKVISSQEFSDLISEKLKKVQDDEADKHKMMQRTFGDRSWGLERRVKALEAQFKILNIRDKQLDELRNRLEALKDEIRVKARRIEDVHMNVDRLSIEFWNYITNASYHRESLKKELELHMKTSIDELISTRLKELKSTQPKSLGNDGVDELEEFVKEVVKKALEVYDADKTGQVDYALESSGGVILSTRCTETKTTNAQFSILGIPLWYTSRSPRTVIQPGVHPGECWAFPGSTGYLVIQLSERIIITGFTLEHIPRSLASNGSIDSAPKDFSVWALRHETDLEPKFLGQFRFDADGSSLQYYEAIRLDEPYQIVELRILSNHGKMDYTCLYRFRVHGIPA